MLALELRIHETLLDRLHRILAIHFDPDEGSPYWLERARQLGFDPRYEIYSLEDLAILGPMDEEALSSRPIEDFIPRSLLGHRSECIVAETGGTLGKPKYAVHREDEFEKAFVQPFLLAAGRAMFPRALNWLFIGPGGPHIIGKAARRCAKMMGSADPFTVDFDPRWIKKLPDGSYARSRYQAHIEAQALQILETQKIGVIFGTPPLLESLSAKMTQTMREDIMGIHFGGMALKHDVRELLQKRFPNAVMLAGYGNTLFGMCPEFDYHAQTGIDYYPLGTRLVYQIIEPVEPGQDAKSANLCKRLNYGERGQVLVHRLDEMQLIVNMLERDTAIRIPPRADAIELGFTQDGLQDPQPIVNKKTKPAIGLY